MRKKITAIFMCIIMLINLTGCRDRHEVDDFAYVIAVGIDKGKTADLRITFSFANVMEIGGGGSEGGSDGTTKPFTNFTVESGNIFAALDIVNSSLSKRINLSHTKILVFSKEIAKMGLNKLIDGFVRSVNVRSATLIAVSECAPKDYLISITPKLEKNPERYLNDVFEKEAAAFIYKSTVFDFYTQSMLDEKSLTVPLVGVIYSTDEDDFKVNNNAEGYNEDDVRGILMPRIADNKASIMGFVAFNGDKMVGEGTNYENIFTLISKGRVMNTLYFMHDDNDPANYTVVSITQREKPHVKVDTSGESPVIYFNARIRAELVNRSSMNIANDSYKQIQENLKDNLERDLQKFLYRTSQEFQADVANLGRYAKKKFLTWEEWEEYNWSEQFKDAIFVIDIKPDITQFGLLNKASKM